MTEPLRPTPPVPPLAARPRSRSSSLITAAGIAAVVTLTLGSTPTALAATATPAPSAPASPRLVAGHGDDGLFGVQDATYDGVFRQSLAIGGLEAAQVEVPDAAVGWLLRQQCADGSFTSYRVSTTTACPAGGWDSNATAGAVQALVAVGSPAARDAATRAVTWLRSVQDADGGFAFAAGGGTDANSTGLALAALAAVGTDPSTVRSAGGHDPLDAIEALQVDCSGGAVDVGGLAYQPQDDGALFADTFATSGALLGFAGGAFPVAPGSPGDEVPTPTCPAADRSVAPTTAPATTAPATTAPASPAPTSPAPTRSESGSPAPASPAPTTAAPTSTAPTTAPPTSTAPTPPASSPATATGTPTDPPGTTRVSTVSWSGEARTGPAASPAGTVPAGGTRRPVHPSLLTTDPGAAAGFAGGYLARIMRESGGLVLYQGAPDVGQTLNAVLGLTRLGIASQEVTAALAALPAALPDWVVDATGVDRPGSLGVAAMAVTAAGADPADFAGVDYGRRILGTLQTAAATPSPTATSSPTAPSSPTATSTSPGTPTGTPSATVSATPRPTGSTTPPRTTGTPTAPGYPTVSASTSAAPTATPTTTATVGVDPTVPPTPPGGTLPRTGSSATVPLAAGGLALLGLGAVLRLSARRRPR